MPMKAAVEDLMTTVLNTLSIWLRPVSQKTPQSMVSSTDSEVPATEKLGYLKDHIIDKNQSLTIQINNLASI